MMMKAMIAAAAVAEGRKLEEKGSTFFSGGVPVSKTNAFRTCTQAIEDSSEEPHPGDQMNCCVGPNSLFTSPQNCLMMCVFESDEDEVAQQEHCLSEFWASDFGSLKEYSKFEFKRGEEVQSGKVIPQIDVVRSCIEAFIEAKSIHLNAERSTRGLRMERANKRDYHSSNHAEAISYHRDRHSLRGIAEGLCTKETFMQGRFIKDLVLEWAKEEE